MRSCNQLQSIDMIKLRCDLVSKQPTGTTRADGPRFYLFWIRPHQIAESAFMWDLLRARNYSNLVYCSDFRAQSTVDAEQFSVHNGGKDEEVENVAAGLPNRGVAILRLAFFIKAVYLCNLP